MMGDVLLEGIGPSNKKDKIQCINGMNVKL